ncbi:MAG: glycosyltransferase family 2 protein [Thermoflavifilum sp.]|nr:glycosyltransferase family 2 protein [Thermoflavifilum sp.]MCL6515257.1 glycosyltransferase [Alicyclobacillus sp.]
MTGGIWLFYGWWGLNLATLMLWVCLALLALPDLARMPKLHAAPGEAEQSCARDMGDAMGLRLKETSDTPLLSVVVAARNEAPALPRTLAALRNQTLRQIEILVVDDRSTDDTWSILQRLCAEDPRFRAFRVHELPSGWLGKNHALHLGASHARGRWILFMDADVWVAPKLLAEALRWAAAQRLDVLTLAPTLRVRNGWLEAAIRTFVLNFLAFIRPQSAHRARSRAYAGIGAFLLVRRSFYDEHGGHIPVRMAVDDDAALARWLKRCGAREQMVRAGALCEIEWYTSVNEMILGMEKNPLPAFHYHPGYLLLCIPLLAWIYLGPWFALLVGPASVRWLGVVTIVIITTLSSVLNDVIRPIRPFALITWPVGAVIVTFAYLRAAILAWRRGALEWRDTRYPLSVLRAYQHGGAWVEAQRCAARD